MRFQCAGCNNTSKNVYILVPEDELRRLVLQSIARQYADLSKV